MDVSIQTRDLVAYPLARPANNAPKEDGLMRHYRIGVFSFVTLVMMLALNSAALGQESQSRDTGVRPGNRVVTSGARTKVSGIIIRREADTFSVADDSNTETVV